MTHQHPPYANNTGGITVAWFNAEQTIMLYHLRGTWKTEDFWAAIRTGREMIEDVDYDVYSIFYVEGKLNIPAGFLISIGNLPRTPPRTNKLNIIVGDDPLINTIFRILKPVVPRIIKTMVAAKTLDSALAIVQSYVQDTAS